MARDMEETRKATSTKKSVTSSCPKSPLKTPPHKKNTVQTREGKVEGQKSRKAGRDLATNDETKRPSPTSPKRSARQEQPLSYCRLHTQERAIRRAGYNYLIASKINTMDIIRRFEERFSQVMEEHEIKMMRKEMVPKAQLMPAFDKPFHPQRSRRPLTVPKEPSFLKLKCCIGGDFHRHFCYKPIN